MGTTILAWLITILGLLMIAGGIWDLVDLWNQRRLTEIPLRHWGTAIAMICGGGLTPVAHSGCSGCGGSLELRRYRPL